MWRQKLAIHNCTRSINGDTCWSQCVRDTWANHTHAHGYEPDGKGKTRNPSDGSGGDHTAPGQPLPKQVLLECELEVCEEALGGAKHLPEIRPPDIARSRNVRFG